MDGIQDCQKSESAQNVNLPIGIEKKCKKCDIVKSIEEFTFASKGKYGRSSQCRECQNVYQKKWRGVNRDRCNAWARKWREENPLKVLAILKKQKENHPERANEWYHKHKEALREKQKEIRDRPEIKQYHKEWCVRHPENIKRDKKKYRDNHKNEAKRAGCEWKLNNRGQYLAGRKRNYQKISSSINYKINRSMRGMMWYSLRGRKNGSWRKYVDFTVDELKAHLEKQFQKGMNWGNYGRKGWNIDHIIPISAHNITSSSSLDFKKCWALKNLRPFWEKDNISKGANLEKPFQPALPIEIELEVKEDDIA